MLNTHTAPYVPVIACSLQRAGILDMTMRVNALITGQPLASDTASKWLVKQMLILVYRGSYSY